MSVLKREKTPAQSPYGNVVFITGASSGIGCNAAHALAKRGFSVYGLSRSGGGGSAQYGEGFVKMLRMDVTSDESVRNAVASVIGEAGGIDILINAAGYGICGPVEEVTAEEAFAQFNTNYFGVIRLINAILPHMREKNRGLIINLGSVGGLFGLPFQTHYSSSKYAVEALTEGLRVELKPWRVRATLIDPGDVQTGFTKSRGYVVAPENSAYGRRFVNSVELMVRDEQSGMKPDAVSRVILKTIKKKRIPIRRVVGAKYRAFVFLRRLLPSRAVEALLTMLYTDSKESGHG